ncbi:hypothetical protein [Clostridium akagii]|uniref:hypothetical protein n=1 Tax=Clostridium akagii TaxID=91623 RepID=UPI000478A592|nr:hypothetical protein [Clostridium akagii]
MNSNLIWNENKDRVFGYKSLFKSGKDFEYEVIKSYKDLVGEDCLIDNIMLEECISTINGIQLQPNTVIPKSETDIEIDFIYKATIYQF